MMGTILIVYEDMTWRCQSSNATQVLAANAGKIVSAVDW